MRSSAISMYASSGIEYRHRACPTGRGTADLAWKTADQESKRRQNFQVMQLLEMTVAHITACLVAFPDQACIAGCAVSFRGVDEWGVPAPSIGPGQPHAPLQQMQRRLPPHPTARAHEVIMAVSLTRSWIDQHDFQWRELVANP